MVTSTRSDGDQNDEAITPILDSEASTNDEDKKESCWGWVVVMACFLCNTVIDGLGYSFGVLLSPMQKELNVGIGEVAFVGSILTGVIMLSAPVASIFVNRSVSLDYSTFQDSSTFNTYGLFSCPSVNC